jgi:MFS family permease
MGKLVALMFTAFVDMIGSSMILPLVPYYATRMGATGLAVGVILASFSIGQLVSAPSWGRFSDRYGDDRRSFSDWSSRSPLIWCSRMRDR